jgi:hypothetical protein
MLGYTGNRVCQRHYFDFFQTVCLLNRFLQSRSLRPPKKNNIGLEELNLISWNGCEPMYDLRDRSAGHSNMGKGVRLSKQELLALKELLNNIEL